MSTFLSFTALGIVFGAVYGLLAIGLVVTYNTTGVFNFAQGAVGMVAAFLDSELWQNEHWPFLLAIVFIVFVEAPLLGLVVEFVLFRRIHGATVERSLMVSLGLLVILLGVATIFWSNPDVIRSVPSYFTQSNGTVLSVHLFGANGVTLQYQQIMIVVVTAVVGVALGVFLRRARLGVAMRAVVDDPELVALAGAKPYRMSQTGWVLGFMLAALAGVLIAPLVGQTGLTSTQLTLLALNGFAAAVVGRLRSLPMTFVGALVLGLITYYAEGYLPGHINAGLAAVLVEVIPVVFLFVALLVIPAARLAPAGRLSIRSAPKVVTARQSGSARSCSSRPWCSSPPLWGRRPWRHSRRGSRWASWACRWSSSSVMRVRSRCASSPSWALGPSPWARRSEAIRGGECSWPSWSRAQWGRWWRCPRCACAASISPWPHSPSEP